MSAHMKKLIGKKQGKKDKLRCSLKEKEHRVLKISTSLS